LDVQPERIYVDHGFNGTNRDRPGLLEALAACHAGDALVVTKLDRPARSMPDARDIADELAARQVRLNLGGTTRDPTDPIGKLLFNVLAMVANSRPTSSVLARRAHEGRAGEGTASRSKAEIVSCSGAAPRGAPRRRRLHR
jgi:DNA invertase Pin-like site-specific DNA recombinase